MFVCLFVCAYDSRYAFGGTATAETAFPGRDPEICNSNKAKLGFAGTGSAKQVSVDLPLQQHVAPKPQRPKYRFVARNAATRRFSAKKQAGFCRLPERARKAIFQKLQKASFVLWLAAKASLALQANLRVPYEVSLRKAEV